MYQYLFLTACNIYNVIKKITDPHSLQNRLILIYFLSVRHKNLSYHYKDAQCFKEPPPPKKKTILKTNMLIFENGIKLLIFHVAIKFNRNSLKDKVLVQWYQICAMYTYVFLVCINWYTYSCVKTFTPLRKTFFDSNVSLIHMSTVWFANPNYCILIYVYIFVLYTLFNIIYLIKSWKEKNSLLYMNLIC